jgi:hypothetical protein
MTAIGRALLVAVALTLAAPALAQRGPTPGSEGDAAEAQEEQQQPSRQPSRLAPVEAGRVAKSAVGSAGQRQTRADAAPNIEPMSRITNRINNRVQSRIRNRIDRHYDPQANAASPFKVAEDEARTATTRAR